jgi:hypothetical protein
MITPEEYQEVIELIKSTLIDEGRATDLQIIWNEEKGFFALGARRTYDGDGVAFACYPDTSSIESFENSLAIALDSTMMGRRLFG